jgi:hypothetical protein
MERLFSPWNRYGDTPEWLRELKLDVSTKELLSAEKAFTYADLYAMLKDGETAVQLTPHAFVVGKNGRAFLCPYHRQSNFRFSFNADGKEIVALARSTEHLLEICDVVLGLLAGSVVQSVYLVNSRVTVFISSVSLTHLMEQCRSLKALTLESIALDESHCRVLGVFSRPDLEIVLKRCTPTSAGMSALGEVLGRNQGPTRLDWCDIDNFVLAEGMRGNSRLKSLTPRLSIDLEIRNRQVLAIANALRENKGLVELMLRYDGHRDNDETWGAICDSLKTHPTLQVLQLWGSAECEGPPLAPAVLEFRVQALLDMLNTNLSIHMIHLHSRYSQHEIYRGSVIPHLEANRLRPHVRAIQKTRPITYRAKVLGKALVSARTDPNSFWMLLSGNAEIASSSNTTTITAAANLPTPTPVVTTAATTNAAAVTASVMSTTTTGSLPATAAAALPLLVLLLLGMHLPLLLLMMMVMMMMMPTVAGLSNGMANQNASCTGTCRATRWTTSARNAMQQWLGTTNN